MNIDILILIVEAMAVYFLVLWAHSLRHRFGPIFFYALMGGITAIMSWVTDAGAQIQVAGITFMAGSTVFYTSLLLGVFVVYVFDGPRAGRNAIFTVVRVSILVPLIAVVLHFQIHATDHTSPNYLPLPSLRINTASVMATMLDLIFLAIAWEFLGKPRLQIQLWLRVFLTLLGVMWLDVILFATGAFAGNPAYLSIMQGTLISRFIITVFACPLLYAYLNWQNTKKGIEIENRPVLSILKQVAEIKIELSLAQHEIELRKQAVEALRESEERYRLLIENQTDMVVKFNTQGELLFVSPSYCKTFDKTQDELLGKKFIPLIHEDDRETVERAIGKAYQPPYTGYVEERAKTRDGWRWQAWLNTAVLNEASEVEAIVAVGRDITDQKQTGDALRKSEEKLRTIIEHTNELFYIHDKEHTLTYVSQTSEDLFGYTPEEMMIKWTELATDNPINQKGLEITEKGIATGEKQASYLLELEKKDGTKVLLEIDESPVKDATGKVVAISGAARDVTEQKRTEQRLLKSEKMEAIATLAGGIAHKFNNALSAITGNADLLDLEFPGDDKIKRYVTPMKESAHQMAHLSAQLLAYARGGKYNPEIISPTDFVKDTLPLIEHTIDPDIRIETDLPSDIMSIDADNTQMQMVLSAIIANSNDAIEDKGHIRIRAKDMEIDEGFVKAHPALRTGPYIALTLEDDGRGMDEETKNRIFEPFFTSHFMGRGLGMAAVYGIIRNHDGWITVDSELGRGTKVVIYLPAISAESKAHGAEAVKQPEVAAVGGTGTVLIIEDEEIVLEVTKAMIEALGYRVLTAKTGKEAIALTESFDGDIVLALLDIKLPDMEGGTVYRRIMEIRPDLKVIVCSGYTIEGPAQEILDAGAQGFIHKPASLGVLSDEVKKVLEGK